MWYRGSPPGRGSQWRRRGLWAFLLLAGGLAWLIFMKPHEAGDRVAGVLPGDGQPARASAPATGGPSALAMGPDSAWFGLAPLPRAAGPRRQALEQLGNLGYMSGYQSPPPKAGVLVHEPARAMPGVNLCLSAHKASAALLSMEGRVLHEWSYPYDDLPEALRAKEYQGRKPPPFFRFAHAFENGDLLAIYDYRGLIRLDRFSRLLWYRPNKAHHDFFLPPGGGILTLAAELRHVLRWNEEEALTDDYICFLDPMGVEQKKVSIGECFENSPFRSILKERAEKGGDLFHANKLQLLDGSWESKNPAFKKGNILLSLREPSALAVADPEEKSIVWYMTGAWKHQHESRLLPDGRLALFDNQGYFDNSRVMEIDPFTGRVLWEYCGDPPESFSSFLAGDLQSLPNGGRLVTDTVAGRAFELAPGDDRIVWEYVNPHRMRKRIPGEQQEQWFIAALFQMQRLPPGFPLDWIPRPGEGPGDGAM